ncbi:MAG TPA: methyltransferase domain-containing protein [Bacteroidia bacterium]|nr:methyltransferase domain-containing protein [Bacteroidia bacterium]
MNWKIKAALQKVISHLPFAQGINYFMQRYFTGNLPMDSGILEQKRVAVQKHFSVIRQYWPDNVDSINVYEFGAGYDMAIPLGLYFSGIRHQVVTDIKSLIKPDLVQDAYQRLNPASQNIISINNAAALMGFGIAYRVPVIPSATGLPAANFDFIHSTDTLEHIPAGEVLPILEECYRLLKQGGVISCIIDLQDHYAYFDKSLSPFNFYNYPERKWNRLYNNYLQYQNRLRVNDFIKLFADAGFVSVQVEKEFIKGAGLEELYTMQKAEKFEGYKLEDLAVLRCHISALKK